MDALINIALVVIFVGAVIWAAVAPGMQALIPTFLAIASALGLVRHNTDWITNY